MLASSRNFKEEENLFESLINERVHMDKDTENIDKKIWSIYGKRRSILFTDLCGFSNSVHEKGIIQFIQKIYVFKSIFMKIIEKYNGHVIKIIGDSFVVLFETVDDAVNTTIETQSYLLNYNKEKEARERIFLCAGIGYGDILVIDDKELFGDEVNIASKLGEDTAEAYEILISEAARNNIGKLNDNLEFEELSCEIVNGLRAYKVFYNI